MTLPSRDSHDTPLETFPTPCALDWHLQPVLLDSTTSSCCCPFPPTFASPWRNSFVQIHRGTTLLKANFGTTPQKRPKNDLDWGVGRLGARQAEGFNPRNRRAPLATRQSLYGICPKTHFFSSFRVPNQPRQAV